MSIKTKLGLGIASAALGLSLVGGGTFAYFSDMTKETGNFAAGTLDINTDPATMVKMENLKPGDHMVRAFKLKNDGSLDIKKVLLDTQYVTTDAKGDNAGADLGEYIRVDFLYNKDKVNDVIYSTTLAELKTLKDPDAVARGWFSGEKSGLKAKSEDELYALFTFVDNGKDQNVFQGDTLDLTWVFNAQQGEGEFK